MNAYSNCVNSVCLSGSNCLNQCMCSSIEGTSVDELVDTLNEVSLAEEADILTPIGASPSDEDYMTHLGKETTDLLELHESESTSVESQKCCCKNETCLRGKLSSCSTAPSKDVEADSEMLAGGCPKCSNTACACSTSVPLVSALKGSREKRGMEPKKLNVTWAPDVYDPPPRPLSPVAKTKRHQRSRNKKENGKSKQRGKASRGSSSSSSKSKRQSRKISGYSDSCFKTLDVRDRRLVYVDDDVRDFDGFVGLDFGSPDGHCGSSFLKKSLGKVHVSVAEAL